MSKFKVFPLQFVLSQVYKSSSYAAKQEICAHRRLMGYEICFLFRISARADDVCGVYNYDTFIVQEDDSVDSVDI